MGPYLVLAKCRVGLALLNLPLAYISFVNPNESFLHPFRRAFACLVFLFWMVLSYGLLTGHRRTPALRAFVPLLDVLAAAALVGATGGIGSPFVPWLSIVALGSVVVSRKRDAVAIGLLTSSAILLFALDAGNVSSLSLGRALWAGVFALFGYVIGASHARNLGLWSRIEAFSAEMGGVEDVSGALGAFRREVEAISRPTSLVLRLEIFEEPTRPRPSVGANWLRIPVSTGVHDLGEAHVARPAPFSDTDRFVLHLLGERLASALVRIRLYAELIDEAARQERLALADELHDTTIQTLTALDLGATVLGRLVAEDAEAAGLAEELGAHARGHIAQVRRFLRESVGGRVPGPESLTDLLEERWSGRYALRLDPGMRLSEARWRLLGLMAREGLNNARKHGQATRVSFSLAPWEDGFEARLEADGRSPGADVRAGYGLTRLRAVAAAQRASVELREGAEGGSVLTLRASVGGRG